MHSRTARRTPGRHRAPTPPRALRRTVQGVGIGAAVTLAIPLTAAASFGAGNTSTPITSSCATIGVGAKGPAVAAIQRLVGASADGAYGPVTAAAVRTWQAQHRVPVTGSFDAATWAAVSAGDAANGCGLPVQFPAGSRPVCTTLGQGTVGAAVAPLQRKLGVGVDRDFGPVTRGALVAFQKAKGVPTTGTTTVATWAALGLTGTAACGTIPGGGAITTASTGPVTPTSPSGTSAQQAIAATVRAQVATLEKQ
ncbi:MAG TPA: peptidoglycan-binding domain-containing protein, partial [Mycobacteriales bacterium]|nr:peptidoglycan-binding domain-containing protein [Mycobacteriales bacterium]